MFWISIKSLRSKWLPLREDYLLCRLYVADQACTNTSREIQLIASPCSVSDWKVSQGILCLWMWVVGWKSVHMKDVLILSTDLYRGSLFHSLIATKLIRFTQLVWSRCEICTAPKWNASYRIMWHVSVMIHVTQHVYSKQTPL